MHLHLFLNFTLIFLYKENRTQCFVVVKISSRNVLLQISGNYNFIRVTCVEMTELCFALPPSE